MRVDIYEYYSSVENLYLTYIDSELTAGGFTLYAGQTAGGRVDQIDIRGN